MADVQKSILLQVNLNIDQLKAAAQQAQDNLVKLKAEKQQLIDSNQKDTVAWAQNAEAIRQNQLVLKQSAAALNINQQLQDSNTGSLTQQQQAIKALTTEYYGLSEEQRVNSDRGKELKSQIAQLNDSFKGQNIAIGNTIPNVGNYNKSILGTAKGLKGLGGLGVILSRVLGIDPNVAQGIREAGLALKDFAHTQELVKVAALEKIAATKAEAAATEVNTVATEANATAQAEATVATEAGTVATEAGTVAMETGATATGVLTAAWETFTAALAANPFTAILVGLVALGGAAVALYEIFIKQSDAQKQQNEVSEKAADAYTKEVVNVRALAQTLQDANISQINRNNVLQELQSKYPGYLNNITTENSLTKQSKQAIDDLIKSIQLKAEVQAAQENYTDKIKDENKVIEEGAGIWGNLWGTIKAGGNASVGIINAYSDAVANSNDKAKTAQGIWQGLLDQINKTVDPQVAIKGYEAELKSAKDLSDAKVKIASDGSKAQFDAQKQLALNQYNLDSYKNLNSDLTPTEKAAQDKLLLANYNKEIENLTNEYYDRQLKNAQDNALALLNIKKSSGQISDADFDKQEYALKKKTLDDELKLYADNAQKVMEIKTQLKNLDAENISKNRENAQKEADVNLKTDEDKLKANYDAQLNLLTSSQTKTTDEIAKNNLEKLQLEQQYQAQLFAMQLSAAIKKRDAIPQFNTDGSETTEYKAQQDVILNLQNSFATQQIANAEKTSGILNSIKEEEFKTTSASEQKYFQQQEAELTKRYANGEISEQEYNDGLTKIKLDAAKTQLQTDIDYGKDSVKDAQNVENLKIQIAKEAAARKKKIIEEAANTAKTVADAAIDVENNNAKAASDYKKQVLDKELAAKSITQSQYDAATKKLQHDDAVREKQVAEEKILVNTAVAVIKAVAESPETGGLPGSAIAAVEGAAQFAVVQSAAIPFAKGGKVLPALNGLSGGGIIGMNTGLPISRSNGDNRLSTLKTGEVVLTEDHQRKLGGARTFAAIGVPGFSGGGGFINSAVGREGLPGMGYGDVMNMIKSMPPQVLKISDLNFIQGRATKIQDRSNF